MAKDVTLMIDGAAVTVPAGTMVVDAAKKIGIDIPVFCYHPKMEPVGMCRMCLVEIGRPMIDRATNQPVLEPDGKPKIQFGPKLDTGCTTPVSEGMVVVTASKKVADARRDVVEFILTSHPLDCPVCDKGGECPLQNLTMGYGPGLGRFQFEEKMHLAKHYPLGDLIYLDRERCIQCARCVRFQADVAGDAVIGFNNRGRSLEITTQSEPGFDSVFSGNTTDICPVGALTTADFRFGARSWEIKPVASICSHCPVGCNLTMNIRREAAAEGKTVIKRVMPRQNEAVNETWICDKGRFGYHYVESKQRLTHPLLRKNGELVEASWDEALDATTAALKKAGSSLVALAGGRLSNEDLFNLGKLARAQGGKTVLHGAMAGGDLTAAVGLPAGSNLGTLGKGAVILVIASDLYEEAPIWYLRLKAAAKRGAQLIVAAARPTKLERFASNVVRYRYGEELSVFQPYLDGSDPAFREAEHAVIFFGSEGLSLDSSAALAGSAASLLAESGKAGKVNSGLVGVWQGANTQGAWDLGFAPAPDLGAMLATAGAAWIAAADPAGDDPSLAEALDRASFVIVQELFLTATAQKADVVFPAQAFAEREGTYTSGESRVQRFYQVVYPPSGTRADFAIPAAAAEKLGLALEARAASLVFKALAAETPAYAGLDYTALAQVEEQWPIYGRNDLYYGGTGYQNDRGLGVVRQPAAAKEGWAVPAALSRRAEAPARAAQDGALLLVPVARLYDQGQTLEGTCLLDKRKARPHLGLNPETARQAGLTDGEMVSFELNGQPVSLPLVLDDAIPAGAALLPRSAGVALTAPAEITLPELKGA